MRAILIADGHQRRQLNATDHVYAKVVVGEALFRLEVGGDGAYKLVLGQRVLAQGTLHDARENGE
jgi:hypothetical protein